MNILYTANVSIFFLIFLTSVIYSAEAREEFNTDNSATYSLEYLLPLEDSDRGTNKGPKLRTGISLRGIDFGKDKWVIPLDLKFDSIEDVGSSLQSIEMPLLRIQEDRLTIDFFNFHMANFETPGIGRRGGLDFKFHYKFAPIGKSHITAGIRIPWFHYYEWDRNEDTGRVFNTTFPDRRSTGFVQSKVKDYEKLKDMPFSASIKYENRGESVTLGASYFYENGVYKNVDSAVIDPESYYDPLADRRYVHMVAREQKVDLYVSGVWQGTFLRISATYIMPDQDFTCNHGDCNYNPDHEAWTRFSLLAERLF